MELDERSAKWLEHLKTWQQSGSTQADYCKKNGLHQKTFSNRKRELREYLPELPRLTNSTIVPPNPVAPLVAVNLSDAPHSKPIQQGKPVAKEDFPAACAEKPSGISLSIGGKYQISVATDFDSAALRRLLTILVNA